MPPPHRVGALSDDARLTSGMYIWPKSRTERPRKTNIGTEVGHVKRDLDNTFKVRGQLAGAGAYCGGLPAQLVAIVMWFVPLTTVCFICTVY